MHVGWAALVARSDEVEHVPGISHPNRWVGASGACGDEWIVARGVAGAEASVIIVEEPFDWFSVSETKAQQALGELAKYTEQIKKHAASVLSGVADRREAGRCVLRHDSGVQRATL